MPRVNSSCKRCDFTLHHALLSLSIIDLLLEIKCNSFLISIRSMRNERIYLIAYSTTNYISAP